MHTLMKQDPAPRVLMVLKRAAGFRGMQQQARRVALRLQTAGVPVSLVTQKSRQSERVPPWTGRLPAGYLASSNQWGFSGRLFHYLCRHRNEYDVVHVHGLSLETFAAMAARRVTGKPLLVKPGAAGAGTKLHLYGRLSARTSRLAASVWRPVDAWISISEQTRCDLLKMGVAPSRIASVSNGVDTGEFRPLDPASRCSLRHELGIQPDDLVVCTSTYLAPHKRVDLLIRAFLMLAPEFPRACLWVMGTGEQFEELQALCAREPLGERVRLWGHLRTSDLVRKLQAADIFALLSRWEGLSNALLEAMACGLPPVVGTASGMVDVVQDGVNGLLLQEDGEVAVADKLRVLLTNGDDRRRLGEAAARTVAERFSLELTVTRLMALYQSCAARASCPCFPGP
jgi:glycosyltransferase involved in cell wall biosynthesis